MLLFKYLKTILPPENNCPWQWQKMAIECSSNMPHLMELRSKQKRFLAVFIIIIILTIDDISSFLEAEYFVA